MKINVNREFCYRIYHVDNLYHVLTKGLCCKHHPDADPHFTPIGNASIIDTRDDTPVRLEGYGNIGDYVPFYFTPRSIMLYNIVTGYRSPLVSKVERENIIVIRARINDLKAAGRFFFTDGQANDALTTHYSDLANLESIDWDIIRDGNFSKSDGDLDRPRRYQAEFLVNYHVPISSVESINVYHEKSAKFVGKELVRAEIEKPVNVYPYYFF